MLSILATSHAPLAAQSLAELDGGVTPDPTAQSAAARGKYILHAAGCLACHTEDAPGAVPLTGAHELQTEFGTFYSPNITPDPETGIGGWSNADFRRAVREGIAPDGRYYYPAFPYTSYARMTDADVDDLFAYLQSVQPVRATEREHDLRFPYSLRSALGPWRWLYFDAAEAGAGREEAARTHRGAYLASLGHCGECHTPRGLLGAMDQSRFLRGAPEAPDISQRGDLGRWSRAQLVAFLRTGFYPDSDVAGGTMEAVITDGTSILTQADVEALADYLRTVQ